MLFWSLRTSSDVITFVLRVFECDDKLCNNFIVVTGSEPKLLCLIGSIEFNRVLGIKLNEDEELSGGWQLVRPLLSHHLLAQTCTLKSHLQNQKITQLSLPSPTLALHPRPGV